MFETVYQWILQCLQFALDTFTLVLESTGTTNFYVTGFFVMFAVSAFFSPLIFHRIPGASDGVQPRRSDMTKGKRYNRYGGTSNSSESFSSDVSYSDWLD